MKKFSYILIGFLIFNCGGSDRPSKPDNLIPEEKMSEIIYDVFLLNAAKGINKRILEQNGVFPQEYVYNKYSIDSLQFALSNDYYSYDTKTYEGIMESVKERVDLEKKKVDTINKQIVKTKDSLRLIRTKLLDSIPKTKLLNQKSDTVSPPKKELTPQVFGKDEK